MLFHFQSYIEELREKEDKKEIIEKYEKLFGPITWDIKDQIWFTNYLSHIKSAPYNVPEELKEDFDRDVLIQLIAGSFSSEWVLDQEPEKEWKEFIISVQSGDQSVVKKVSELWGFQILRLYEIYIEEQLNLQILMEEDAQEKDAIIGQRELRIERRNMILDNSEREKLVIEAQVEKEEKLANLYDQL